MGAKISGISYYLPDNKYTNDDFLRDFPQADLENLLKTGITERRIVAAGETASDMAEKAARLLFSEYNIDPQSIDFLILCNLEPDYYTPPTSCVLHGKLGLKKNCGTLDYNHGCSAYVYGLGLAQGIIESMGAKNVLLLTVSTLTHTFHPKDKSSRYVFGDAASATLITHDATPGLGPYEYGTDGSGYSKIIIEEGGYKYPLRKDIPAEITDEYGNITTRQHFRMDGVAVFLFSVKTVPVLISNLLEKAQLKKEEPKYYVFHQPNRFLNESIRKKAEIPPEKFIHDLEKTGNTVQATIPIALKNLMNEKKISKGDTLVLAGFGVGLSWAATIARF